MSHRLVLVLAVAACHHAAVHKPGDEYLAGVKFEGNHAFHDKALLTGLELHRSEASGRAPDGYMVQVDAERIRGQYLRAGYLDVDVRPRIERAGVAETVIFTIEEGVPATTRIAIDGIPDDAAVKQAAILAVLPIANGAPFDYAKFDLARDKLLGVVQDAGYAHARLDAEIVADRANRQAIVEPPLRPRRAVQVRRDADHRRRRRDEDRGRGPAALRHRRHVLEQGARQHEASALPDGPLLDRAGRARQDDG